MADALTVVENRARQGVKVYPPQPDGTHIKIMSQPSGAQIFYGFWMPGIIQCSLMPGDTGYSAEVAT